MPGFAERFHPGRRSPGHLSLVEALASKSSTTRSDAARPALEADFRFSRVASEMRSLIFALAALTVRLEVGVLERMVRRAFPLGIINSS